MALSMYTSEDFSRTNGCITEIFFNHCAPRKSLKPSVIPSISSNLRMISTSCPWQFGNRQRNPYATESVQYSNKVTFYLSKPHKHIVGRHVDVWQQARLRGTLIGIQLVDTQKVYPYITTFRHCCSCLRVDSNPFDTMKSCPSMKITPGVPAVF